MNRRLSTILLVLFFTQPIYAQARVDSLPVFNNVASFKLLDTKDQKITSINLDNKRFSLFVFLSPECPLCQNYTRTINELREKFSAVLTVYGIVPGNAYTVKEITAFEDEFHTSFKVLLDGQQAFTNYLQASVTPQAILLDNAGRRLYSGAIDDWVQALGKKKLRPGRHYVQDAILQSMKPEAVKISRTTAYGCKINDY